MEALFIWLAGRISLEALVIAITGYVIVFTALVLLFFFFNSVPRLLSLRRTNKSNRRGEEPPGNLLDGLTGEEAAAIAMALHLYLDELHDEESGVLTIKRISKTYSPWSSKIYAVRNQFNRN